MHMWSSPLQEALVTAMITKAHYEKVKMLAAGRCQVANDPTKMKLEPGLKQLIASGDAMGLALLEQQEGMHQKEPQLCLNDRSLCVAATLPTSLTPTQVAAHPL